ncbi:MAG: DEAD/DEAH box helicase, partial [Bacteroidota bacterium]
MKKNNKEQNHGYQLISQWMKENGMTPFSFQKKTWDYYARNYSGLVVAPTGFGKTYSVFLAVLMDYVNQPHMYFKGLKLLWITPLRSLSKDLTLAMQRTLDNMGIDWKVGLRNGDISQSEKQRQNYRMPDVLVITPESLHLMMAQKSKSSFFAHLKCVVVDEWHELLGTKRGVLTELALVHLKSISSNIKIWGLTATIGNLEQALEVLIPHNDKRILVKAKEKKKILIKSLLPEKPETLPWAGHMGSAMVQKILPVIKKSKSTLLFTNTRNQAETWYRNLLEADPDLAGLIAIHHSSIDTGLRNWIEDHLASGYLKVVVCTSSLDLGVDFKPVDTVIQIGSPKGVARFFQRAGRSGHSPHETSKLYFVPTHTLELVEAAAIKQAYARYAVESREPFVLAFDVLVQFLVTLAVGEGFYPEKIKKQILSTFAFRHMSEDEWQWALLFI